MRAEMSNYERNYVESIKKQLKIRYYATLLTIYNFELLKIYAVTNNTSEIINSPKTTPAIPNINIKPINMSLYNVFIICTCNC